MTFVAITGLALGAFLIWVFRSSPSYDPRCSVCERYPGRCTCNDKEEGAADPTENLD